MLDQNKRINKLDWDYLIILDACRYDYFERMYKPYLKGKLHKARSSGTTTAEWLKTTYTKKYDLVYISSNPFINSHGFDLSIYGSYKTKDHFDTIVDVWDFGWDETYAVVLPKTIRKETLKSVKKNPGKKHIIHYVQPHAPYLNVKPTPQKGTPKKRKKFGFKKKLQELFGNVGTSILIFAGYIIPRKLIYKMVSLVWYRPIGPASHTIRFGKKHLRMSYGKNVELVLKDVEKLIKNLDGKIVITADHGELLGENGKYGHPFSTFVPELCEVPWFVIEK